MDSLLIAFFFKVGVRSDNQLSFIGHKIEVSCLASTQNYWYLLELLCVASVVLLLLGSAAASERQMLAA